MSGNYLLGNMLSALHNKDCFYESPVTVKYSRMCNSALGVMKENGYISKYSLVSVGNKKSINVWLRVINGKSYINTFKLISKPGRRLYLSVKELKKKFSYNQFALLLVSTPKGIMSASDAIKRNVGGELLCEIF